MFRDIEAIIVREDIIDGLLMSLNFRFQTQLAKAKIKLNLINLQVFNLISVKNMVAFEGS